MALCLVELLIVMVVLASYVATPNSTMLYELRMYALLILQPLNLIGSFFCLIVYRRQILISYQLRFNLLVASPSLGALGLILGWRIVNWMA